MATLFGTDGVRGVANADLTPELAFRLGRAGATVLANRPAPAGQFVVVGRDTRRSGDVLESALAAGIASAGLDVHLLGVVPTPGVAYLTRELGAAFGVMISASHNPPADNGIKFFSADGFKPEDELEDEIEALVRLQVGAAEANDVDTLARPTGAHIGRIQDAKDEVVKYTRFLLDVADVRLDGLRVVVDCAHGAAYDIAPTVLRHLGAEVIPLFDAPDGMNINVDCGSTHPEAMQAAVRAHGAHAGLAHDGDADRVIMADADGNIVDGDQILTICGLYLKRRGLLQGDAIAATVYSNLGLQRAFADNGTSVIETPTGDRHVLQAMRDNGLILGGEQSGHIIFLQHNTTGDGLLAALQVLRVMQEENKPLSELAAAMERFPQILEAVSVRDKDAFHDNEQLQAQIAAADAELKPEGQLFVRPSGTEPVIRIMGEGEDEEHVQSVVDRIVAAIQTELG